MLKFINRLGWLIVWTLVVGIAGWFAGIMTYILVDSRKKPTTFPGPRPTGPPPMPGSPNWQRERDAQEQQQDKAGGPTRVGYNSPGRMGFTHDR